MGLCIVWPFNKTIIQADCQVIFFMIAQHITPLG